MDRELHKFGRNPDIDDSDGYETLWEQGGIYEWPTTDGLVSVASSSNQDGPEGNGALTMTIEGLGDDFSFQSEDITLNGVTPVLTTKRYRRVFRAYCGSVGTGEVNTGDITLTLQGAYNWTVGKITAGIGQTQLGLYTVPLGQTLQVNNVNLYFYRQGNAAVDVVMRVRNFGKSWREVGIYGGHTQGGPIHRKYEPALTFPAKTDIEFRADVSADNTGVAVDFDGRLI